ncbi:histidine kinase [uncultured Psychroserpens sp.]|uniref:tetratricopeptide repeat-containing sensor histidine kinase n=1 Tax=uncultured Psychroserpens sp. TaxID=255436 RepID=UPI002616C21E|nr:histidine kinase [uncultured Psychroserpens sp.]
MFSQSEKINQHYVDTLLIEPIDSLQVSNFKNILLSNDELKGWTKYYAHKSFLCLKQSKRDSALFYSEKTIDVYNSDEAGYTYAERSLQRAYYVGGWIHKRRKNYNESLNFFLKSLDIHRKYPDHYKIEVYILTSIAEIHLAMGNPELSLRYQKQIEKDSLYKTSYQAANLFNQIGILYGYLDQRDSSKIYLHKSLKYESDRSGLAAYTNLGELFYKEEQMDSAIHYFSIAKRISDTIDISSLRADSKVFAQTNYHFVDIYNNKHDKETINVLTRIVDSVTSLKKVDKEDRDFVLNVLDYLILAYEKERRFKKVKESYKKKFDVVTLFNQELFKEDLQKIEVGYKTKLKEEQISNLEQLNNSQKQKLDQQKITAIVSICSLFLGVLLIIVLYKRKTLKDKYEKVNLEQRLLLSQMNPHFTYNALNSVYNLLDVNSKKAKTYLLSFSKLLRSVLENSRKDFISLEEEIETLDNYLVLKSKLMAKFEYVINCELTIADIFIPPMLIQPFVENAIIHGISALKESGKIEITFSVSEDNSQILKCIIVDNGVGYANAIHKKSKNKPSISSDIVNDRLKIYGDKFKVNANFQIVDLKENGVVSGTKVILETPIIKE